jgi:Domain of unknown function (DUF4259)
MGAWDATSFGNDTANDWAYDLEGSGGLTYIEATLQRILDAGEKCVKTRDAEKAIAAAEVLAWLRGRRTPVDAYTEDIAAWVDAQPIQPPAAAIKKALAALDRIEREPSDLLELWAGDPDWQAAMSDLRNRLTS